MSNLRLIAARVINEVTEGSSLSDSLETVLPSLEDLRDRAFVQAVSYGVCRFYFRLDIILSHLLKKPMKAKDGDIHALILAGLYQLMDMRVPPHAAVAETVNAAQGLRKPWAQGLINAVLREYLRREEEMKAIIASNPEAEYAHPDWWLTAIKTAWPKDWQEILEANNKPPPFSLRVNQQHITRENYLAKLQAEGLQAHLIPETEGGLVLETAVPAERLPGFLSGEVSVQDGAAQLAVELLDLKPDLRILDACAAPGGKLTHILEKAPQATLIALEKEPQRMKVIRENLTRLNLKAECICDDAGNTAHWWDGQLFDRILLDAPCSASGVVRRHPDIKLLRRPSDLKKLAQTQQNLLHRLWPLLKPEGLLVYVTCSIFPEENTQVVQAFLAANADAKEEKISAAWGVDCEAGRQILPGMHNMDGFYYARFRKMR